MHIHVCPIRPYDVIIGGTTQFGSSKMTISKEENKYIVEECSKYEPTIKVLFESFLQ